MNIKNFFYEILKDIRNGKNLDAYFAVLLNAVLAVLSLINIIPTVVFNAALLTSLSWISLNVLIERKENESQISDLLQAIDKDDDLARSADFFVENYVYNSDNFETAYRSAQELCVIGMGQTRMIISYSAQIRRILNDGGEVKFLLGDPDGVGTEMATKRGSTKQSLERTRQEHWSAIERLSSIPVKSEYKVNLSIRFADLLMPYTMYGFDLQDPENAKIFVWVTVFQEPSEKRPGFVLSARYDEYWFKFFKTQFDRMWNWSETNEYQK